MTQPSTSPTLSMEPTITTVVVTGAGLAEPLVTLHGNRQAAVRALADAARTLLRDRLEYVPLALAGTPDLVTIRETLQGNGYAVLLEDLPVAL